MSVKITITPKWSAGISEISTTMVSVSIDLTSVQNKLLYYNMMVQCLVEVTLQDVISLKARQMIYPYTWLITEEGTSQINYEIPVLGDSKQIESIDAEAVGYWIYKTNGMEELDADSSNTM